MEFPERQIIYGFLTAPQTKLFTGNINNNSL